MVRYSAVQVEAGGEGVKELLHMLGTKSGESPTVGILGYEGTGKTLGTIKRQQLLGGGGEEAP